MKLTLATILAVLALGAIAGRQAAFWFSLGGLMMGIFAMWEAGGKKGDVR
jgi:hypothetical protein